MNFIRMCCRCRLTLRVTVKCQLEYAGDIIHFKYAPMYSPQFSADSRGGRLLQQGEGVFPENYQSQWGIFAIPLIHLWSASYFKFSSHHFSDETQPCPCIVRVLKVALYGNVIYYLIIALDEKRLEKIPLTVRHYYFKRGIKHKNEDEYYCRVCSIND